MVGTGKAQELINKVIEMRFENNQFETATSETMKTLGRLESSCKNFDTAVTGLAGLGKAASGLSTVTFTGVASGIHTVVDGFSTMGTIGDTVLRNLTNRVTDFVMNFVGQAKHFTSSLLGMESVMGGFSEYEDKLGSIQTIKTNTAEKGSTLEDITKTLDELNHYADQTIYSFKEMTRNIGTFTAAGVSLEDSATAIKGISNLAAGVGSTPQQAANAMYQLSQALASGTVNLQDWNSVVNAGMGGQYFQNALKETARELAKAKGVAIKEFQGTFRESIAGNAKGAPWLTSEVLLETLKKFANDPSLMEAATRVKSFTQLIDTMKESVGSGWTETWEYLIGNLDEAGDFFTMISKGFDKIVGSASDSRNAMMKFWHDNGGRDQLIKALVAGFKNLSTATKPIRRAFTEAFPPIGKERLLGMTEGLLAFVSGLKLADPQLEFLRNASDRVFGGLKILLNMFKGVGRVAKIVGGKQIPEAFSFLISVAGKAEKAFYGFVSLLEHFLGIDLRIPTMDDFTKFGNLINDTLDKAKKKFADGKIAVSEFYSTLADGKVKEFVDKQAESFKEFVKALTLEGLKRKFVETKESAKAFLEQFNIHIPTLSDFWSLLDKVADSIWGLGEKFQNARTKVAEFFASVKLPESLTKKKGFWLGKGLSDETTEAADGVEEDLGRTKSAFDYLIGAIDFVFNVAGHIIARFMDIFRPVIDTALDGIAQIMNDTKDLSILDIMKIVTVFMTQNMYGAITQVMDSLGGLGETLSGIGESIGGMVEGAKGVFEGLQDTLGDFQKEVNSHALINIAVAVAILAGSVIALSMIDVDAGLNALFSISVLVGEMLGAMSLLSKIAVASGKLTINLGPIIVISLAAGILAFALAKLATLNINQLGVGLLGVTTLLAELVGVSIILGKYAKKFGKGSTSLIMMAFAVSKLASVVISLGDMDIDALLKGIGAVGALVLFLTAFAAVSAAGKGGIFAAGLGVLLLASGIKMLSGVIDALGGLDNERLIKGGAVLGILTAGIIAFSYALWAAPVAKLPVVGIGLIAVAAGMTAIATSAFLFSRFSWTSLGKAGAAIGGILLAVVGASWLVRPLKLIALAGALVIFGVALTELSISFKILASLGWEGLLVSLAALVGMFALMGGASVLLAPLIPTILALAGACALFGIGVGLLGAGAVLLGAGLTSIGAGLATSALSIGMGFSLFIAGLLEGAGEILHALSLLVTSLGEAFYAVGMALVEATVMLAGPIAGGIAVLIIVLFDTLTRYMDPLIDKCVNFIDKFLDRLLDDVLPSLGDWAWKLVAKVADLLLLAIEGLVGLIPGIGQIWREGIADVRKTVSDYWDDVIDERQAKRRNERKMRMIEEGLMDAAGNVNIAGAGGDTAQSYVDDFVKTLRDGRYDISDEAKGIQKTVGSVNQKAGGISGRSGGFDDVVNSAEKSVGKFSGSAGSFAKETSEVRNELEETQSAVSSVSEKIAVAQDVINGKFGNGDERRGALERAGYDPDEIQKYVNDLLSGGKETQRELDEIRSSLDETALEITDVDGKTESLSSELDTFGGGSAGLSGALKTFSNSLKHTGDDTGTFSGRIGDIFTSISEADEGASNYSETLEMFSSSMDRASDSSIDFTKSLDEVQKHLEDGGIKPLTDNNWLTQESLDSIYSFSPTITPILDLSDVNDGMYYLQNEFGNNPAFGMKQTWTPDVRNAEALLAMDKPNTDVNKIVDEIGFLRGDVVNMGEQMSKIRVFLDTGALVGEMSAPMDTALGQAQRRSMRSGRW